jgi:hypothetical protein
MRSRAKTDTLLGIGVACSLALNLLLIGRSALKSDSTSTAPGSAERAEPTGVPPSHSGTAASAACRANLDQLPGELQQMHGELLRVSLPHEAFALLESNPKLTARFNKLVTQTLAPGGAQNALQEVQCRGPICRVALRSILGQVSTDYDTAVAALRASPEIQSSLSKGFSWGPIQYARDPAAGRDVRVVPLYLALRSED